MLKKIYLLSLLLVLSASTLAQHQQHHHRHGHDHAWGRNDKGLHIVTSFSDFAAIAKYIVQDKGYVEFISDGKGDPHFVPPKPSYAMKMRYADMWVTTGLDLEVWSTTLLDKARNKKIMDGEIGFVAVSDGVPLLQKVDKADRTEGDIHMMGNPHIHTSPLNWKHIARNITIGLQKVDPDQADFYITNRDQFYDMVDRSLFGDALVDMFGGETLDELLRNKTLFTFLDREYQGGKLLNYLGGWLKDAIPFRDKKIIAYHKNWAYFSDTFGLDVAGYVEPKPGIPPSAKHVQNIINLIESQNLELMLVATYFEKATPQMIENRTGIHGVYLPLSCGAAPGTEDIFDLMDSWIQSINEALE
ncbi:zinc ABC transporter substrate-binding protein [candidate division KSB1 bacterium]|nr:zinc ABC transporter substrate-binding protein [candidate division KSB1 bacterium]RQW03841.1 MAG: zinc ABC transporter substrate-binding protein [candidate division KSB1 bacterium]